MDPLLKILQQTGLIKECFFHPNEECTGKVILSHSLQKNGKLTVIEEMYKGNNSMFTPTSYQLDEEGNHADLIPVGKAKASTFHGFCAFHDKNVFQPIEDREFDSDSDEQCFLHSLRAFAHSYHTQKQMLKAFTEDSDFTNSIDPKEREGYIQGYEMGVNEGETFKARLIEAYNSKNYGILDYYVTKLEGVFPIASIGVISPTRSISGVDMNNHANPEIPYTEILLTVVPDGDRTVVIFATLKNDDKGKLFVNELESRSNNEFKSVVSSLMTFYAENTFFAPSVWEKMTIEERTQYLKELDFALSDEFQVFPRFQRARTNFFQNKFKIA